MQDVQVDNLQALKDEEKLQELETLQAERDKRRAQEFAQAYQQLVHQYGYELIGVPQFVPTHTGTFELVVSLAVNKVRNNAS